jgi:hypothetical protein
MADTQEPQVTLSTRKVVFFRPPVKEEAVPNPHQTPTRRVAKPKVPKRYFIIFPVFAPIFFA